MTETKFTEAEQGLLQLIKESLQGASTEVGALNIDTDAWNRVISMAESHSVLSLLYDNLVEKKEFPEGLKQKVKAVAQRTAMQQYRLLFFSRYLVEILEKNDIEVAVMKGVTVGQYYPIPELRKSGDVDLLLTNIEDVEKAKAIMLENGFWVKEEQLALHHVTFASKESIDIEIHTMLAEPFDNERTNRYLQKKLLECKGKIVRRQVMGVELPVLPNAYFAFELLLHMLQHFLRSGFGLKLLCDWVVFWKVQMTQEERKKYLELVEGAGIKRFSEMITRTCIQCLGMDEDLVKWMDYKAEYQVIPFVKEILEAEEFGKSNTHRMVIMRGTRVWDYVREFHHQMHLNYPKMSRCFFTWPVLWVLTLIKFLQNNRTIRNTSTREILREAKRRSELMEQLQIFR